MTKRSRTDAQAASPLKSATKLAALTELLTQPDGADLATMMEATGWQAHSVRGALAGSLKKKGVNITSEKIDGRRVWRASRAEG